MGSTRIEEEEISIKKTTTKLKALKGYLVL
jgi:hypothetical protein